MNERTEGYDGRDTSDFVLRLAFTNSSNRYSLGLVESTSVPLLSR